mmetsp:Transcript_18434/g.57194  ORF Transcript_18434/g.57194 Transcript_18434/m.57194 type:complete len:261 (-) Transcript_18434:47-829(-)
MPSSALSSERSTVSPRRSASTTASAPSTARRSTSGCIARCVRKVASPSSHSDMSPCCGMAYVRSRYKNNERTVSICSQWSAHAPATRPRNAVWSGPADASAPITPPTCLATTASSREYSSGAKLCRHMSSTQRYSSSEDAATGVFACTALMACSSRAHVCSSKFSGNLGLALSGLILSVLTGPAAVFLRARLAALIAAAAGGAGAPRSQAASTQRPREPECLSAHRRRGAWLRGGGRGLRCLCPLESFRAARGINHGAQP